MERADAWHPRQHSPKRTERQHVEGEMDEIHVRKCRRECSPLPALTPILPGEGEVFAESPQESLIFGDLGIRPTGEDASVEGDEEVGGADSGCTSAASGAVSMTIRARGGVASIAAP